MRFTQLNQYRFQHIIPTFTNFIRIISWLSSTSYKNCQKEQQDYKEEVQILAVLLGIQS